LEEEGIGLREYFDREQELWRTTGWPPDLLNQKIAGVAVLPNGVIRIDWVRNENIGERNRDTDYFPFARGLFSFLDYKPILRQFWDLSEGSLDDDNHADRGEEKAAKEENGASSNVDGDFDEETFRIPGAWV
jgi:hypothetical protein